MFLILPISGLIIVMFPQFLTLKPENMMWPSFKACKDGFVCCKWHEEHAIAVIIETAQSQPEHPRKNERKGMKQRWGVKHEPTVQSCRFTFYWSEGSWLLTDKTVAPLSSALLLPAPTHEAHSWTHHVNTAGRGWGWRGGGLIRVNYMSATCNPCSQCWNSSKASSQVLHMMFKAGPLIWNVSKWHWNM